MPVLDLHHLDAIELPTSNEEIWRYSRIGDLTSPTTVPSPTLPISAARPTSSSSTVDLFPDETPDVFAGLNRTAAVQVRVVVPAGTSVEETISITHTIGGDGGLVCPRS